MRWNVVSYSCHYGLFAAVSFVHSSSGDSKNFYAFDFELICKLIPRDTSRALFSPEEEKDIAPTRARGHV